MESFKMSYEDKMKKRQASNMLILNKLSEYIEKYPDLRFGQILINLEILQIEYNILCVLNLRLIL